MSYHAWLSGTATELGRHRITRDEIVAFAGQFDPQAFHLDDAAAEKTLFGALCASGWHTAALWMRAYVCWAQANGPRPDGDIGISPGFRDMNWLKPVYPGDELRFFSRVAGHRKAERQPGFLLAKLESWADKQGGVRVFEFRNAAYVPDPDGQSPSNATSV